MVVDTSAILAILQLEPEAESFASLLEDADVRLVSSVSVLEAGILVEARKGKAGARELDAFLLHAGLSIRPFDSEQAEVARDGFRRFGKGRHRAGLNLGDCASYALSRVAGEPLLFKGDDFVYTDVAVAAAI
jgi:ribonuclease VapC